MIVLSGQAQWTNPVRGWWAGINPENQQVQGELQGSLCLAHLVWQEDAPITYKEQTPENPKRIVYRRFTESGVGQTLSGTWSVAQAWEGTRFRNPSISLYAEGNLSVVWSDERDIFRSDWNGSGWGTVRRMHRGYNASLATGFERPSLLDQRYLYVSPYITQTGAPLYRLRVGPQERQEEEMAVEYAREIGLEIDENSLLHLVLDEPVIDDGALERKRRLRFIPLADTMQFRTLDEFCSALSTEPFIVNGSSGRDSVRVSGAVNLRILHRQNRSVAEEGKENPPNIETKKKQFHIIAMDHETGRKLRTLGLVQIASGRTTFRQAGSLAGLSGQNIRIGVQSVGLPNVRPTMPGSVTEVYRVVTDTSVAVRNPIAKASDTPDKETAVPAEFALHPAYPNPFNPSTSIRFDLPKPANVSIVAYDLLGREVAIMVDEFKDAGYYEVTFDASNLSSGVYLYKLSAETFTNVKKMLLIR